MASRAFVFSYLKLFWLSWCIYFLAGFFACTRFAFIDGIIAGLVAGLGDATIGWCLSTVIGPYIPGRPQHYSIVVIAVTIVMVSLLSTLFGLLGATICKLVRIGH
jgi:hypothetical protein